MKSDYKLESNDNLTRLIRQDKILYWEDLTRVIKSLPYGRNKNRIDLTLVWKEQKGTCSSKHAFLKHVADLNDLPNVELILGMYKMNAVNTPKIGNILTENHMEYIPEAHCYLRINNLRLDFTSPTSDFEKIKDDILIEQTIAPHQVAEFKAEFHKAYLKNWIKKTNLPHNSEEVWQIREQCIANLSS